MADFADIDQQLAALGAAPEKDASALLERVLGTDRSRARLDELLAELSQAWTPAPVPPPPRRRPSSHPPRALGRHHVRFDEMSAARTGTRPAGKRSTLIGLPSSAPPEPSGRVPASFGAHAGGIGAERAGTDAARFAPEADTDLHSLAPQPESWSFPDTNPGAELARAPAATPSSAGDADSDRHPSIRPPSAAGFGAPPSVAAAAAPDPEQTALDERERKRESQRVMRALLEQDLDPKDFADPPVPAEAAADDELELVVEEEEEEILELDDIELLEDDE